MCCNPRPSRRLIEAEFYSPLPLGQGRQVRFNPASQGHAGPLVMIGFVLRWEASYYVAGPDFAHAGEQLRQAVTSGRVAELNRGEAQAAQVSRHSSLLEAIGALCALVDQALGPEAEPCLQEPAEIAAEDLIDIYASAEDPTYAQC